MNLFNEREDKIFDYVFKELNISKKTKKFWDYLFENILVPEYITIVYADKSTYCKADVYKKQIALAKKYNENIEEFRNYNEMVEEIIKNEIKVIKDNKSKNSIENLISLYSKNRLKEVIEKNNYLISEDLSIELIKFFDINELYRMNIVNEKLIIQHIEEFDKQLFYELGFKNLSSNFIDNYFVDMELLDMSTIDVDRRPNIGIDKAPLYMNAGCCLGEKHYNGVDVYIPYGIWCDIFKAIEISSRCISKEIDSLRKSIENLEQNNSIDNYSIEKLKSNLEFDIENLKKHKMLLDNFSDISYEV